MAGKRFKRVLVSFHKDFLALVDDHAYLEKRSRSALMREALGHYFRKRKGVTRP